MNTINPIIPNGKIKKVNSFKSSRLINDYRKIETDAKRIFGNLNKVDLYECLDSKFQFFWPREIVGDSRFYEELSKHDWYYSKWRWEHEISSRIVNKSDIVLEVGCGSGFFLERIRQKVKNVVGLDLNEDAIKEGLKKKIKIKNESIQDFSKKNKNKYSIVCSYQVLEHVIDVGDFIKSCLDCLKPGGKLLISVPNNVEGSLIVNDGVLNMPPHHMGRWSATSLGNLAKIFNLNIDQMLFEPAGQEFQGVYRKFTMEKIKNRHPWFYLLTRPILKHLINYFVNINSNYLQGHSVFVSYKKL